MKITKKQFVKEWINDLRSGKFRKCTGKLYKNGCYCALGVACKTGERLGIPGGGFAKYHDDNSQTRNDYSPGLWFEKIMGTDDPFVLTVSKSKFTVIDLNDAYKYKLRDIADALERTYLKRK